MQAITMILDTQEQIDDINDDTPHAVDDLRTGDLARITPYPSGTQKRI